MPNSLTDGHACTGAAQVQHPPHQPRGRATSSIENLDELNCLITSCGSIARRLALVGSARSLRSLSASVCNAYAHIEAITQFGCIAFGTQLGSPCCTRRRNADYGTYDSCREGVLLVGAGMGVHGPRSTLWGQDIRCTVDMLRLASTAIYLSAYHTPWSHGRTILGIESRNYQRLIPPLARDCQHSRFLPQTSQVSASSRS